VELTVAELLRMDDLELQVIAGADGTDRHVRWAHAIELADPVPWLRGGELVLTVGLGFPPDAEGQRRYVRRLAEAGCAGIGFADEVRDAPPDALLAQARQLRFPVIAVLGTTPFLAISQAVASWYSDAALAAERRAISGQEAIARATLRSSESAVTGALATAIRGQVLLLDSVGRTKAASPRRDQDWHQRARELVSEVTGRGQVAVGVQHNRSELLVHSVGAGAQRRGWLAAHYPAGDTAHPRLLVGHAATLLAVATVGTRAHQLRLHEQRAVMFADLLRDIPDRDVGGWPRRSALLPDPPFEVVSFTGPGSLLPLALESLDDVVDAKTRDRMLFDERPERMLAVLPLTSPRLGPTLRERMAELGQRQLWAGAASARTPADLPAAARRASELAPRPGSYLHVDDVSAWSLLRDGLAPPALSAFTASVLGPLREYDSRTGGQLAESLRAYLDADGNLEAASGVLGIHRNTLRSRLRTAQRVSQRSLERPSDRLELWLALRAPELLGNAQSSGSSRGAR
jgi:purine catabolism regulatory family protein/PucR-like helix-turn-helix protein